MSEFGYPCLYVVDERRRFPLQKSASIVIGRDPGSFVPLTGVKCSRRQVSIEWAGAGYRCRGLSDVVSTFVNGRPSQGEELRHGDRITFDRVEIVYLEHVDSQFPVTEHASGTISGETILGAASGVRTPLALRRIDGSRSMTIGRDPGPNGTIIDHPIVSRRHAEFYFDGESYLIRDLRSANGTFVAGRRIDGAVRLHVGDSIAIGPANFVFDGSSLSPTASADTSVLRATGLRRTVKADGGERKVLLDGVSLEITSGEFCVIIGGTGAGKSTLLAALSAREPAESGVVLLDGSDLYSNFESVKSSIALVAQRESLHENLTLEETLRFTAKLRLPPDTSTADIESCIDRVTEAVELAHVRRIRINRLSGGQRRRASLANEIISQPKVLFIDEATSGLDNETDGEMMRLFRKLADQGLIVVCVTHSLAHVEATAHRLCLLAPGGVLLFDGRPAQARSIFGVHELADIYRAATPERIDAARVKSQVAPGENLDRMIDAQPPSDWHMKSLVPEFTRQFRILTQRYLRCQVSDQKSLLIAAAQCLVVGVAIHFAFGRPRSGSPEEMSYLFLLGMSCLWFGTNNAAREIVKERPIYLRERNVRLSIAAYVASKAALLCVLGILQSTALYFLVREIDGIPGREEFVWATMAVAAVAGTAIGLLISAAATSTDQAVVAVPSVLIPQVIFSGHVNPNLPVAAKSFAEWSITEFRVNQAMVEAGIDGVRFPTEALAVATTHAVVALLAAFVALLLRDSLDQSVYGRAVALWVKELSRKQTLLNPRASSPGAA